MSEQSTGSGTGATLAMGPRQQCQAMSLGTKRDHLMGAGKDESQEVSRRTQSSQQTSKKQNCTGGKGGLQKPGGGCRDTLQNCMLGAKGKGKRWPSAWNKPKITTHEQLLEKGFSYKKCKQFPPQTQALCSAPGVRWPWELAPNTGSRGGRAAVPQRQAQLSSPQPRSPARLRTQQQVRVPARANYDSTDLPWL